MFRSSKQLEGTRKIIIINKYPNTKNFKPLIRNSWHKKTKTNKPKYI